MLYRVECLERFLCRTVYMIEASGKAEAEAEVIAGRVAYESMKVEEGDDEFVNFVSAEVLEVRSIGPTQKG